jgi:hypothetical protein
VSLYLRLCRRFGNYEFLCRGQPRVSEAFRDSLEFLKWDVTPKQIIGFSRFAALVVAALFSALALVSFLIGFAPVYSVIAAFAVPLLLIQYITEHPKSVAKIRVLAALGEAPKTLIYLIIPLKQNPNLEEAVRFAAQYGEGEVAEELKQALWKSWSGKAASVKEELPAIGLKWGKWSPDFKRAIYLVRSSLAEKYEANRLETLDRALKAALEGIASKTRSYVAALFLPTLVLFSFGTILPLMFISMLPIISYFGLSIASPLEISLILGATVLLIYLYSNKIIMERPPSFSQPAVPELQELPPAGQIEVFGKRVPGAFFAICLALLIGFPGIIYLLTQSPIIAIPKDTFVGAFLDKVNTLTLVWGIGIGIAVYCWGFAAPRKKIRDGIKEVESEILDGIYQAANRMAENRPAEDALEFAAESMPGTPVGRLFEQTAKLVRRRNVTLEQAFFSEKFGTLRAVYSRTVQSIMRLFVVAAKRGVKAATDMLFTIVDHFSELKKTEKELREMIGKSISMLRSTVVIFAPVVSGVVVTLHSIIQSSMLSAQRELSSLGYQQGLGQFAFLQVPSMTPEVLQLIVGLYMVCLSIVLIRYVSIIENGPDEVEMKLQLAKTLPVALAIFTGVLLASRMLLGG